MAAKRADWMVDKMADDLVEHLVERLVDMMAVNTVAATDKNLVLLLVVTMGAYSVSCSADLMAGRTVENKALKMAAEKEFSMDCTLVCSMVLLKAEIAVVWSAE